MAPLPRRYEGGTVRRTRALLGIAAALGLIVIGAPAQAAPSGNGNPPQRVTQTFNIPVGFPFGHCDFNVTVVATGKVKTIKAPNGRTIALSANFTATATGNGQTSQYKINGSFTQTTAANGNITTKATGRNLLSDPIAGVVVTSGNFSFTFDKDGNLIKPLKGTGHIIDVCADLA
jgi:hypothetical protein